MSFAPVVSICITLCNSSTVVLCMNRITVLLIQYNTETRKLTFMSLSHVCSFFVYPPTQWRCGLVPHHKVALRLSLQSQRPLSSLLSLNCGNRESVFHLYSFVVLRMFYMWGVVGDVLRLTLPPPLSLIPRRFTARVYHQQRIPSSRWRMLHGADAMRFICCCRAHRSAGRDSPAGLPGTTSTGRVGPSGGGRNLGSVFKKIIILSLPKNSFFPHSSRQRERERNISQSPSIHTPQPGIEPAA